MSRLYWRVGASPSDTAAIEFVIEFAIVIEFVIEFAIEIVIEIAPSLTDPIPSGLTLGSPGTILIHSCRRYEPNESVKSKWYNMRRSDTGGIFLPSAGRDFDCHFDFD
ncbi:MAG: hypothetical protein R2828_26490 [Saprospiraceae bacterium]